MNNIFKVIWNHATQTWTAVGELASAKGKSKSIKLAAISTALLAVAGGAQVQAAKQLVQTPENDAGLSVSVVNTDAPGSAKAYAYDGIAIGNNSVAGQEPKLKFDKNGQPVMKDGKQERESQGNGHVAIGLMARATGQGAPGNQASVAVGAYALAKGRPVLH